ncbi:GNAT superfamily N-acetyltransferase [Saccharomonospora amisosensis]|uniref:GNAT superfamily N-acetyltransferase n=1 Tax=Saccharomonospora amisosensis TaxID=1128677 RepID=A0A7X5UQY2_9PSEU|nr:GNAT family N-acetyltransferase [Saccharomonospora amisosensis]NIJ12133.1 GNAT superfamily N-acetyltransferase [Saccharomonospora amisosensis]
MADIIVRPAQDDDLPAIADLRWRWVRENGETPAVTREEFAQSLAAWARENRTTHRCVVGVRETTVLGMAWLAVLPRVPTPSVSRRLCGDVQCVYVVPDERDGGLGGRLVDSVLRLAAELRLERVTVHSSPRAIRAYERRGFASSPRLLQVYSAE